MQVDLQNVSLAMIVEVVLEGMRIPPAWWTYVWTSCIAIYASMGISKNCYLGRTITPLSCPISLRPSSTEMACTIVDFHAHRDQSPPYRE